MSLHLSLPCRVITLNVQLGPAKGGTTLEALVSEAIKLGRCTTQSLADFFALPEPVIGDVVHSLWNGGWIWIDFDTGRIGLTERERSLDPASDPGARTERREYLYEPLSQLVFSHREGARRPHRDQLEVPADAEVSLTLADTAPAELRGAVQRLMLEEQKTASDSVVLSVLPAGLGERQDASLRWVSLKVGVATNENTGRLFVQAVDPTSTWPVQAVARLSSRLADYVERWPQSRFSTQLRSRATEQLERFPGVPRLLDRLTQDLERPLKQDKIAAWRDRQNSLAASARGVSQHLDMLSRLRARVDLLTNAPARLAALHSVIGQAKQQLIVVCPTVRPASLEALINSGVERALERNVQLVLLWGPTGGGNLPAPVAAQLAAWRNRFPGQLTVPQSAAQVSANLVIADDQGALVGSHNLLDSRDSALAAAWIRATEAGRTARPPQAILELLAWTRSRCPDWVLGRTILTATELGDRPRDAATASRDLSFPTIPENADAALMPMWRDSWVEYRNMLTEAVRAIPEGVPVVELLLDGEIGEAIADAVNDSTRRLAIADDSTDTLPLQHKLLADMDNKRTDGVTVRVDCPPPPEDRADPLFDRIPNGFQVLGPPRGRVVMADHQIILGSARPLTGPLNQAAARRSQVALRIHSRILSDEMADWLGVSAPGDDAIEGQAGAGRKGARDALTLAQGAQLVRRDQLPLDDYLHRELDGQEDPWPTMERLRETGVDPRLLASVVATILQRRGTSEQQRTKWTNWLIGHLWERGSFVSAALLSTSIPDCPQAVPATACLLAAAIEHAPLQSDLDLVTIKLAERNDAWTHTIPGRSTGAAGLLADYLLGGHAAAAGCISLLATSLPPIWQDLASTVVQLYGEIKEPLPVADIASLLDQSTGIATPRAQWEAVATKTEKLIALHTRFNFRSGKVLYRRITADDGILTRLLHAAKSDDPQLRRTTIAELPTRVTPYFDDIVKQEGEPDIAWRRHRNFLEKVEQVFRTARAATASHTPSTAEPILLRPADLTTASWLSEAWDELRSQAHDLTPPHHLPLLALLDHFRPLVSWQETQP
ncbi:MULTISPECIES: hypothetical protein [unclassified Streptomyces]|uniref:hypothetical protein n=1 Tax=unclassified Streptomyces TaxID=2593676 RepID=UPI00224F48A9|nr:MULTISPECIES: hypothetical protein [unclassified Streptomyces]MCX4992889.1 hypothetical protein [Streptomyces sp. NBC_00568]MCX5001874.1 hypothetical protein [Streptomyces sp. NBC_00638]